VDAPPETRRQVDELTTGLRTVLGELLVGFYAHGSLALGCFNAARSDIDVLAVAAGPLDLDTKLDLADLLLRISAAPHGIELHVLTTAQLDDWRHPSAFEFHYGELHRESYAFNPVDALERMPSTDADLAAFVTVARSAGLTLVGPSPKTVFPQIPFADYADSVLRDFDWARKTRSELYGVLTPCRIWATLATGNVHSKATGAAWALERLPDEFRTLVERALASYTGAGEPIEVDEGERQRLLDYVAERVRG